MFNIIGIVNWRKLKKKQNLQAVSENNEVVKKKKKQR
jgi:hypothetical protein